MGGTTRQVHRVNPVSGAIEATISRPFLASIAVSDTHLALVYYDTTTSRHAAQIYDVNNLTAPSATLALPDPVNIATTGWPTFRAYLNGSTLAVQYGESAADPRDAYSFYNVTTGALIRTWENASISTAHGFHTPQNGTFFQGNELWVHTPAANDEHYLVFNSATGTERRVDIPRVSESADDLPTSTNGQMTVVSEAGDILAYQNTLLPYNLTVDGTASTGGFVRINP